LAAAAAEAAFKEGILMASTIRVRATSSGETTEVQALIQHPMDSGFVKDAKGEIIPPHFIQELTFEHGGKNVFVADWGAAVSKDPYVKFSFKGGKKGDDLKISWVDNKGATDTTTAKIQ
jgi:sulfur-oxidizing protein SoxZ